jgi:hypothetical protein
VVECVAMRRGLCAAAVCAGLALSGCVAFTDPATNVTQSSARLNAHGRTDDYPAYFYFRYANKTADLPTTAAGRTPQRTVPAHRPPSGEYGNFGENVTGLASGRVYFYEVCGADIRAGAQEACGGVQKFFTKPTAAQDSVQGSLRAGSPQQFADRFSFEAASGPQGENVDGLFLQQSRSGFIVADGRVTCLAVSADRAAVGVVGKDFNGNTISGVYTVIGNESLGFVNQFPPNCAAAGYGNQQPAFDGTIAINDASP